MSSVKRTAGFEIAHPVDKLFPLFTPEGQKLWVPEWNYDDVMGNTELHEGYVFLTQTHDHAATDAVWIVKKFEPDYYLVEYYKVEAGHKVGVVTVRCEPKANSLTRIEVSYEYISLSKKGQEFVQGFGEAQFEEFIGEWEAMLIEYFENEISTSA